MYDNNNIFAKILKKEIPSKIIFEDDEILAFHDINPKAKIHVLVIPKGEYRNLEEFATNANPALFQSFFNKIEMIADKLGIKESGYRVITNTGKDATQTVFHFHAHILGGETLSEM